MNEPRRVPRFDDSLPIFADAVTGVLGDNAFDRGRALRDAFGRLGYLSNYKLDGAVASRLRDQLARALGPYCAPDSGAIDSSEYGFTQLWAAPTRWEQVTLSTGKSIYLDVVDRRIVAQDWLAAPDDAPQSGPRRLVFWSAKGGVGRSTALSVLAVHLAQAGHNVLVIDADLEAPGLGPLLLDPAGRPRFGLLDYLADNGLSPWRDDELAEFVAPSLLTDRIAGQGLVDVAPAVGTVTQSVPENMLAKLSRAMLEDPSETGEPVPVRVQLRTFVDRLAGRRRYDAVLIDARAGLAELAAGALFALGATTLIFGVDQTQTFEDFRYLFAHLARMPHSDIPDHDWRRRFRFVQAKADPQDASNGFKDRLYEVLSEELYEDYATGADESQVFNFSLDDPNALHAAVSINFDFPFMRFDPVLHPAQLRRETYRAAFSEFLSLACGLLDLTDDEGAAA
jgi:hypothetical protein